MDARNGGPAFPTPMMQQHYGMSLRDWFAGQALAGICAHPDNWGLVPDKMGRTAYEIADSLLATRERKP